MSCMRTRKVFTNTPLDANEEFETDPIQTEMYNQLRGLIIADQDGTLEFEESDDGQTWIKTDSVSITSQTGEQAFAFVCHARYARVKLKNGGTPQTTLLLAVYADPFN